MIKISKEHHELKIAYLKDQINKLPHGYFGRWNGQPVVYVNYDPDNPKIDRNHKRRFLATSPKGIRYGKLIEQYTELKNLLDMYVKLWNATYIQKPREITYPLRKKRPDPISIEFFEMAEINQNNEKNENNENNEKNYTPIEYNGQILRSKNELIGCKVLEEFGFAYKVEVRLDFDQFNYTYPDFIFYVPEIEKIIILEIDGAIDSPTYESKSYRTTAKMVIAGLVEGKDFVVVRIGRPKWIDAKQIESMISAAIEASINDIII